MTQSVLEIIPELIAVVGGIVVFVIFALAVAMPHRTRVLPGSSGHREKTESGEHEIIRPDGFIDGFGNDIDEAGGSLPVLLMVALPGILIWWLVYLITNWVAK